MKHACARTKFPRPNAALSNHELLENFMVALYILWYTYLLRWPSALRSLKRTINQTFLEQSINPRSRSHCVNRIIYTYATHAACPTTAQPCCERRAAGFEGFKMALWRAVKFGSTSPRHCILLLVRASPFISDDMGDLAFQIGA